MTPGSGPLALRDAFIECQLEFPLAAYEGHIVTCYKDAVERGPRAYQEHLERLIAEGLRTREIWLMKDWSRLQAELPGTVLAEGTWEAAGKYAAVMYPEQRAAFESMSRIVCVEASTKAGKTHGALKRLFDIGRARPGNHWWVAPVYAQAKIGFVRFQELLKGIPHKVDRGEMSVALPWGSTVYFKSAKNPDHLYGEDVQHAVVDEASRCSEASIVAVRSTLTATKGLLTLCGNVRGRGNMFYKMCRAAQAGTLPDAEYHRINAYTVAKYGLDGLPDDKEIQAAKATLPPHVFQELYLADPSGSDTNPFGLSRIDACVAELSNKPVVALGVDLAKSVDYTVIIGLDEDCRVAAYESFQADWGQTLDRVAEAIGDVDTYVDATGVGSPIVDLLHDRGVWVEPYVFTQASKQALMERLAHAIAVQAILYPQEVAEELETMEYQYRGNGVSYAAADGFHDDRVMALGLALAMWHKRGKWDW